MNYKEQLKLPEWQKRRLKILERDNFTCQICGETHDQLHVHHLCYHTNRVPWEYDDNELITLCDRCHKTEHYSGFTKKMITLLQESGLTRYEFNLMLLNLAVKLKTGDNSAIDDFCNQKSLSLDNPNDNVAARLAQRRESCKHINVLKNGGRIY